MTESDYPRMEVLSPAAIHRAGELLMHKAVLAGFGDGRRTVQSNMLVAGLDVADLPADAHAFLWTHTTTRHGTVLESHKTTPLELDFLEPNDIDQRALKVYGAARRVADEELPTALPIFDAVRRLDERTIYPLTDYLTHTSVQPPKALYVASLTRAEITASELNADGSVAHMSSEMPVGVADLLHHFVRHPGFTDISFNRPLPRAA